MSPVSLERGAAIPERTLLLTDRLVTCDPRRETLDDPLGIVEDGALLLEGGKIALVGPRTELEELLPDAPKIWLGTLVTPGLVDAHTHAAYVGSRHEEYALRMAGAGYEEIARAGGGIVSSMRAVRRSSRELIAAELERRLDRMASLGVTTVEVKSGYGLDLESELKLLGAVSDASRNAAGPRVIPTYLALHALPPEANGDRASYARRVAENDIDAVADTGLARFVDVYVDRSAFSVEQARPTLLRARARGLGVRLHVGQFADVGGAELAAEVGASSADHLEHVSMDGAIRLASAGVVAVLLPVASFTLGQAAPPIATLRDARVRICVASDANPGTAPSDSLPLAMAFAVRSYGLTVAEVILGATREAAHSLGRSDLGVLAPAVRADLAVWDLPHEAALAQPHGVARTRLVVRDAVVLSLSGSAAFGQRQRGIDASGA